MKDIIVSKKIVLNKCFGGFGLSPTAFKMLWKMKGFEVYPYREKNDNIILSENREPHFWLKIDPISLKKEFSLLKKKRNKISIIYQKYHCEDIKRDDPDLIKIVEEFGSSANGEYADLKIVEININIQVDNFDGIESVILNNFEN